MPPRPYLGDPGLETAGEQGRIDPVQQVAQPARARHAVMEVAEAPEEIQMVLAPGDDIVEVVTRSDGGAGHQQQDLLDRIGHTPSLAIVVQLRKMLQQHRQPRSRKLLVDINGHDRAPGRIRAPTESQPTPQTKITSAPPLTRTLRRGRV